MLTAKEIVERCEKLGLSDETIEKLLNNDDPDDNDVGSFTLLTTHENIDAELTLKVIGLSEQEKLLLYNALRLLERPDASFTMEVDWPVYIGDIEDIPPERGYKVGEVDISFTIRSRIGNKPPKEDKEVESYRGPEQQPECCGLGDDCCQYECRWYDSVCWDKDDDLSATRDCYIRG